MVDVSLDSCSTPIPIPGVGCLRFPDSAGSFPEGFCSPSEEAVTPPGILTKFSYRSRERSSNQLISGSPPDPSPTPISSKMLITEQRAHCFSCGKKGEVLLCKSCTQVKLTFCSKKENIKSLAVQKKNQEASVADLIASTLRDDLAVSDTKARLLELHRQHKQLIARIKTRREEIASVDKTLTSSKNMSERLQDAIKKLDVHLENKGRPKDRRLQFLTEQRKKMAQARRELSVHLFGVYSIDEVALVNSEHIDAPNHNRTAVWTVVENEGPPVATFGQPLYKIRDAVCGLKSSECREMLATAMKSGTLSLPIEQRPHLSGLIFTMQLVNHLAQVNDIVLPYSLSVPELCIWERWSQLPESEWGKMCHSVIASDWAKLCHSVVVCCHMFGMSREAGEIDPTNPHANLMSLFSRLISEPSDISTSDQAALPMPSLEDLGLTLEDAHLRDRVLANEWDTCEDVDEFGNSLK